MSQTQPIPPNLVMSRWIPLATKCCTSLKFCVLISHWFKWVQQMVEPRYFLAAKSPTNDVCLDPMLFSPLVSIHLWLLEITIFSWSKPPWGVCDSPFCRMLDPNILLMILSIPLSISLYSIIYPNIPSDKHTNSYGKSPYFFVGKSTNEMGHGFNSKLLVITRGYFFYVNMFYVTISIYSIIYIVLYI